MTDLDPIIAAHAGELWPGVVHPADLPVVTQSIPVVDVSASPALTKGQRQILRNQLRDVETKIRTAVDRLYVDIADRVHDVLDTLDAMTVEEMTLTAAPVEVRVQYGVRWARHIEGEPDVTEVSSQAGRDAAQRIIDRVHDHGTIVARTLLIGEWLDA